MQNLYFIQIVAISITFQFVFKYRQYWPIDTYRIKIMSDIFRNNHLHNVFWFKLIKWWKVSHTDKSKVKGLKSL